MWRRAAYFVNKGLATVREAPGISVLTSGTIAAALLLAGLYATALQNLEGVALVWGRTASVTAFLREGGAAADWEQTRKALAEMDGVNEALLVTPHQALIRFRARGPAAAALVEGVSEEILPPAVELTLRPGFADLGAVANVAQRVGNVAGVAEVDYGADELERLHALLGVLRLGGMGAGALFVLAVAFIVSNTIRLTVYSRQDEIAILRLVGATRWFVRVPFLVEGALWGTSGGVLAAALLYVMDRALAPRLSVAVADVLGGLRVHLFALDVALGMVAAGVFLGVLGSSLAVSRFLDAEPS
ncbi:MAG: permease-like cell division protein FtsX [Myxococcota bacterium]